MRTLTTVVFLLLINFIQSQNFSRPNAWKKYRKEVIFEAGASGFLGDLGGLNKIGTDYSPVDIELVLTRPAFSLAYRYKLLKNINIHTSFNYLLVAGDDKLTSEPFRNNRNLNFKSNIFELATRLEFSLFRNKIGNRYSIKRTFMRRYKNNTSEFLIFIGIGGFYFNPKGRNQATGNWENLYPLHTEGQGLPNGPKQYKRISISIPMGIAYKVVIKKCWSVGVEFCYRKTFTDYIDDVHGTYYNKAALIQVYGNSSATFADPNKGLIPGQTSPNADGTGAQRGDKDKDAFMSLQITVGKFLIQKKRKTVLRSKF